MPSADLDQPSKISHIATPDDFYEFSKRVGESRSSIQVVASSPNAKRQYRPLRLLEVLRFADISRKRYMDWLAEHSPQSTGTPNRAISVEQMHQMMDDLGIRPGKPKDKGPLRLLVSNFKGGAQKTTLALQMAHYFGLRGYRVLVVDTDPQGTLTQHMGYVPNEVPNTNTIGVVYGTTLPDNTIYVGDLEPISTHLNGVDLLPANLSMTSLDFSIARLFVNGPEEGRGYVHKMEEALAKVEDQYDLVIIDSPPSFSFMAVCLAWIADGVIVPMATQVPDYAGTGDFCENLAEYTTLLEGWYDQPKRWAPVAFCHARVAVGVGSEFVYTKAGSAFGSYRLNPFIPESKPISNCLTVFKSVFEATSADSDAKGLTKARDACWTLCERIESLLAEGWSIKPELPHRPALTAVEPAIGVTGDAATETAVTEAAELPETTELIGGQP